MPIMKNQGESNIGRVIKVLRTAAGLKQKELAHLAGMNSNYLSLVEAGRRAPSVSVLRAIAKALNVPVSLLFWENEDLPILTSTNEEESHKKLKSLVLEMEALRLMEQKQRGARSPSRESE